MSERYGYTTEYEDRISVDDILAEYEQSAAAEKERKRDELLNAYLNAADELFKQPEPERDEEGVRVYKPQSRISQMEQEALELDFDEDEEEVYEEEEEPEEEIDDRFFMGEEHTVAEYDEQELDTSAEEDYEGYTHKKFSRYDDFGGKKSRKQRKKDKKKKKALNVPDDEQYRYEYNEGFDDMYSNSAEYAPERDYDFAEPEHHEIGEEDSFPTFKEYVMGLVVSVLFRAKGIRLGEKKMVQGINEELGKELSTKDASKYYGSYVHSMRLRVRISVILVIVMALFSLITNLPGALKMPQVKAAMLMAMQFTILLLGLDSFTNSIVNVFRGRIGVDFVASVACVVTGIDALGVAKELFGQPHVPLCLLSSLSFVGVMISALLSARSMRKALRVPAIGKQCFAVSGELGGKKHKEITLLKSTRSTSGFVRRAEEMPLDEEVFTKAAPFLMLFALLLSMIACALGDNSFDNFMQSFSAVLVAAAPICALLSFALPFFVGTNRIFPSGASIAGWSGVCDIGQSKNLIVTDRDIFPESAVEIENIRVFADGKPQRIIAYAGTMISASGCSAGASFSKLMEKHKVTMCHVEDFQLLSGGGMKGMIDGHVVLCGSTDLMRLMNVKLPFRLVSKSSVLLAIDGVLYGIFTLKYEARPQVRTALVNLMKSNRHPIFAIRDFNINPEMIKNSFDVATDGYDFPPYVERFNMTDGSDEESGNIAGVVCLEGLGPLAHMADTGRSIYVATRINVYISLLAAVFGMILVFAKIAVSGSIGIGFLAAFAVLWALPVVVLSIFLRF